MAELRTITTNELQSLLEQSPTTELWNVLTDDYFTSEMIPGSRRVPLDRIGRALSEADLPKEAEIVVHCSGPTCPQSRLAAEKLSGLGYTRVRAYEGGIEAWKKAGLPIELVGGAVATK